MHFEFCFQIAFFWTLSINLLYSPISYRGGFWYFILKSNMRKIRWNFGVTYFLRTRENSLRNQNWASPSLSSSLNSMLPFRHTSRLNALSMNQSQQLPFQMLETMWFAGKKVVEYSSHQWVSRFAIEILKTIPQTQNKMRIL